MARETMSIGIIGAGLGGLAAAIAIQRAGHHATIFEQAPELKEAGAGIQIPPNTSRILSSWGLLSQIEAYSLHPAELVFHGYRDGRILSKQPLNPYTTERYGGPYLHIHRADYQRILAQCARDTGVDIRLGAHISEVDLAAPSVTTNAQVHNFDVVIGADGINSHTRGLLLGHPDPPKLTGDLAYRITIETSEMKKHPELVDFASKPALNYWMGPSAHAVLYLVDSGKRANIVLCCPDDLPPNVNLKKAELNEMHALFETWDPVLRKLLSLVDDASKWKLMNSVELESWVHDAGRFALLGDACHATLPYLAQGAAQAVEDGAVLGAVMARINSRSRIPQALRLYEKLRKPRTTKIVRGSSELRGIFHMVDGEQQAQRDRVLLEEEPFPGYPNRWADPVFQEYMFGYDVEEQVQNAFAEGLDAQSESRRSRNGHERISSKLA